MFVASPHADVISLRLPTWDEAKWWLGRPDTGFYIGIAEDGYKAAPYSSAEGANWAFFPAYPLLLRLIAHGQAPEFYLFVGFCISLVFYGAGTWYLCRLLLADYDRDTVTRTMVFFCFYPLAFSLAIFGPDSLLLLSVCAAFYHARKGHWIVVGLAAGIACVTRVQGALVIPCLIYSYLKSKSFQWRELDWPFLALLLSPAGLFAFAWHLWQLTGNPFAFIGIQRAWNNSPSYPFGFLIHFIQKPVLIGNSGWDPVALTVVVMCAMTGLLVWSWRTRRMPAEYCIFFALQMIVLTCRTSTLGNLRYVTNCFPFFLALGILTKRPLTYSVILAIFAGLFGLFTSLFAEGQQHNPGYHFVAF